MYFAEKKFSVACLGSNLSSRSIYLIFISKQKTLNFIWLISVRVNLCYILQQLKNRSVLSFRHTFHLFNFYEYISSFFTNIKFSIFSFLKIIPYWVKKPSKDALYVCYLCLYVICFENISSYGYIYAIKYKFTKQAQDYSWNTIFYLNFWKTEMSLVMGPEHFNLINFVIDSECLWKYVIQLISSNIYWSDLGKLLEIP